MKSCPSCGHSIADNAWKCPNCGHSFIGSKASLNAKAGCLTFFIIGGILILMVVILDSLGLI